MSQAVEKRLADLINSNQSHLLRHGQIGLEKESLRVSPEGGLATTTHPSALGSALTHPYITTDYSEALTELITPPINNIPELLAFLRDTHAFAYQHLDDELLWAASMPCVLAGGEQIPIAEYGASNIGTMKTIYRRGLGHRYGRMMQVIAGVHYNYSVPEHFWPVYQEIKQDKRPARDFIDDAYFGLIRNLQRYGWLIPYLFGTSPAICKSFLGDRLTDLQEFDAFTYFESHATSLRMGDIGYTNSKEEGVGVKANYNNLAAYTASLKHAIDTPCPLWESIGVKVDGRYEQLNANILQIENEYYSTVRPKQVPSLYEMPFNALNQRGVRYVELRSMDVNLFDPVGINEEQVRFLELFMLFCLLQDSPLIDDLEQQAINSNLLKTAHQGRDPQLKLQRSNNQVRLKEWAIELCDGMEAICEQLDAGDPQRPYHRAVKASMEAVHDPDATPSARILSQMRQHNEAFFHFARRISREHKGYLCGLDLTPDKQAFYEREAALSRQLQLEIEASDDLHFDEFLARYFADKLS